MKRRDFMTLFASATVAWPFGAGGQEAGRTYRLGILWPFPYGTPKSSLLADALRPYGFIDGKNLNIDYRSWRSMSTRFGTTRPSSSKNTSMLFPPAAIWAFAPHRKQHHQFRSSA